MDTINKFVALVKAEGIDFLYKHKLWDIPYIKLLYALGVFLLFLVFRKVFSVLVVGAVKKYASKTKSNLDDNIIKIIHEPLKFLFIVIGLQLSLEVAGVGGDSVSKIIKSLFIYIVFWILFSSIDVAKESIYRFSKKFGKELYREIGAFFIKALKIVVFSIGLVSILQTWGINVSAFIASLGLGGLAFALAAKDTASNLFGGLSILADKALKIDDWIKVGGVEGTVEDIGLRTIKVRTFGMSLVTVPNQVVANNPIENFSRRDIRRIKMRVGLVYSTSREQLVKILDDIKSMIKSHEGISQNDTILVNFDEFGASDLSIFIYCFTNTADWAKYLEIREDVNLQIMKIVEENGSDFAFPSQSVYVESMPK